MEADVLAERVPGTDMVSLDLEAGGTEALACSGMPRLVPGEAGVGCWGASPGMGGRRDCVLFPAFRPQTCGTRGRVSSRGPYELPNAMIWSL